MTDLTQRQLHTTILRSLKEAGKRMPAKYKGVSAGQPAPKPQAPARGETGSGRRDRTASRSPRRS